MALQLDFVPNMLVVELVRVQALLHRQLLEVDFLSQFQILLLLPVLPELMLQLLQEPRLQLRLAKSI